MKSLAVIIPAFNHAHFLTHCITSVLDQPEVNEIIIIDDGSTDDTYKIATDIASNESRVHVIQHPNGENKGCSSSRNLGIQYAKSEWISFCDADDYFLKDRFKSIFANPIHQVDGYYIDVYSNYEAGEEIEQTEEVTGIKEHIAPQDLFEYLINNRENRISLIGLTVRRKALLDIGLFDPILEIGEDTDLIWRLTIEYQLVKDTDQNSKVIRRIHPDNTYHDEDKVIKGRLMFYEKWNHIIDHPRIKQSYDYYQYKYSTRDKGLPIRYLEFIKYKWNTKIVPAFS